jgi:translation initiation factor 3 subunit L
VIRYLHALVKKGGVSLEEEQYESKDNSIAEMFQTLAQFSIIGLARVNCIIGDYVSCLEVLRPINLDQDQKMNPYKRVIPADITLQYYMSFAYMMLRRYDDTTRTLAPFLLYISRNQNLLPRSYIQQVASKKVDLVDMMYGILAITSTISPQTLDDSLISGMNEKFEKMEDRLQGMQEWDETCFEDMFAESCPKFIVPCIPNYDNPSSINEAFSLQIRIFLREIQQRANLSEISSHLKLCASVNKEKLARFLKTDDTTLGTTLLNLKHKNRSLRWEGGAPSDGKWVTSSQVEFFVTKNMVHVSENKTPAQHGDYFIRNILKFEDMIEDMRSRKR